MYFFTRINAKRFLLKLSFYGFFNFLLINIGKIINYLYSCYPEVNNIFFGLEITKKFELFLGNTSIQVVTDIFDLLKENHKLYVEREKEKKKLIIYYF